MPESPWHVLRVIANREKRVALHLLVRSVEHYLPLYRERSSWSDRTVVLDRPLFPGYVFVRYSQATRIALMSTPNVLAILGDGRDQTVTGEEIARIRDGLAKRHILRPHNGIALGALVRIRRGVFAGVEGVAVEYHGQWKVVLSLAETRLSCSLEVGLDDIDVLDTGIRRVGCESPIPASTVW